MRALLLQPGGRARQRIVRSWQSIGLTVEVAAGADDLPDRLDGFDLLAADEFDRQALHPCLAANPEAFVVLWSAAEPVRALRVAAEYPAVHAVMGRASFEHAPRAWELLLAGRKCLKRSSSPPFSSFVRWGATGFRASVQSTDDLDSAVERARHFVGAVGAQPWMVDNASELSHELLMNAVYDAPVDAQGEHIFAHDRRARVTLPGGQEVSYRIACDGSTVCVQVVDPYGSLRRTQVFSSLVRGLSSGQMDERNGGAGLGILVCHQASAALIYEVLSGVETKVTAVMDLDVSRRDFRGAPRSVHFYSNEAPPIG